MNSETIRYLVDVDEGGKPRAFECRMQNWHRPGKLSGSPCGVVTRTLTGMRAHQRIVHAFKPQAVLPIVAEVRDEAR